MKVGKLCSARFKADASGVAMGNHIGLEKMTEQRGRECGKQQVPRDDRYVEILFMFREVLFLISQSHY
jgi:hypothetical protein